MHHLGVRKLEALVTTLVFTMAVCFFINWGEAETNGAELLYGLVVPTMKPYMLTQAVGTIGAVVMPHNLYLHSGLVKSRTVDRKSPSRVHEAIRYNLIESALALAVSFFINVAVVATFADFFYSDTCAPKSMACVPAGAVDDDDFDRTCSSGFASGTAGVCAEIGLAVGAPARGNPKSLAATPRAASWIFRRTRRLPNIRGRGNAATWIFRRTRRLHTSRALEDDAKTYELPEPTAEETSYARSRAVGVRCAQVAAPALRHAMGGFGRVMWGVGLLAAGCAVTNHSVGPDPNFAKIPTACSGTRPLHAAHKENAS